MTGFNMTLGGWFMYLRHHNKPCVCAATCQGHVALRHDLQPCHTCWPTWEQHRSVIILQQCVNIKEFDLWWGSSWLISSASPSLTRTSCKINHGKYIEILTEWLSICIHSIWHPVISGRKKCPNTLIYFSQLHHYDRAVSYIVWWVCREHREQHYSWLRRRGFHQRLERQNAVKLHQLLLDQNCTHTQKKSPYALGLASISDHTHYIYHPLRESVGICMLGLNSKKEWTKVFFLILLVINF